MITTKVYRVPLKDCPEFVQVDADSVTGDIIDLRYFDRCDLLTWPELGLTEADLIAVEDANIFCIPS